MSRVVGLLILCGLRLLGQPMPNRSVFADVPEKARTGLNPKVNDRDAPADGWKLFQRHCARATVRPLKEAEWLQH